MLRRSLQAKVASTFTVFMAVMAGLFFLYQQVMLMPIFSDLEKEFVYRDLERVVQTLSREQSTLSAINFDWSAWDDTYEFVHDRNPEYETGNLNFSSLDNLDIDLLFVYSNNGDVVWGRGFDPQRQEWITFSDFRSDAKPRISALLDFPKRLPDDPLHAGLMMTERGLLLVTARPILDSNRQKESRGVLVMGRLLTGETLEKLRRVAGVAFEVIPLDQLAEDHAVRTLFKEPDPEKAVMIEKRSTDFLVAWRPISDVETQLSFMLQVRTSRDIFRTAYQSLQSGVWIMIAVMTLLVAVLMILVHREVVSPIIRMSRHLNHLRMTGNYDIPFNSTSHDELGRLARAFNDLLMRIAEQSNQLKDLSYEDSLTRVANRRRFNEDFSTHWDACVAQGKSLAVILCDIDEFKLFNDRYGHLSGDKCLHEVAQALKRAANKKRDLVARFGGEEFVILLPDTTLEDAAKVAERIRRSVEALTIEHARSHVSRWVTVSLGVAALTPTKERSPESLLHAADEGLYRAKAAGRNRVSVDAAGVRYQHHKHG